MNNSYTIKDLIQLFLSKIWLIIIVTLVGAAAGFGVSKLCIDKKYSSYITLYVQCYTDIKDDSNQSDISKSKQLIGTYIELLGQDDYVMNQISDDLVKKFDEATLKYCFSMKDNRINPSSLRASLSLTSVTDTSAIKAVATTKNAEVSAAILQSLKEHANADVATSIGVGSITSPIENVPVFASEVSPNLLKNTLLGAAAGFMLIILIVLIVDFFDNTVKDPENLGKKYEKAILGEIAVFGDTEKKKKGDPKDKKRATLFDKDIPFYVKESYKSMRTNVMFALSTCDKKVFGISSPNPGEGKSTTAVNLAITLADDGQKVVLVDCDMRKGYTHKTLRLSNKVGLSSVLSKMSDLSKAIQHTQNKNLDVITAGPIPPNPSELLGSEQMKKMLETLIKDRDVVILDLAPMYLADPFTLGDNIAGILTVLHYGSTTYNDVDSVIERAKLTNTQILGFVINGMFGKGHGGYYKYGKYGKYGKYAKYGYYKHGYYGKYEAYDTETNSDMETQKSDEK